MLSIASLEVGKPPSWAPIKAEQEDLQLNAAVSSILESHLEAVKIQAQIPSSGLFFSFWSQKKRGGGGRNENASFGARFYSAGGH